MLTPPCRIFHKDEVPVLPWVKGGGCPVLEIDHGGVPILKDREASILSDVDERFDLLRDMAHRYLQATADRLKKGKTPLWRFPLLDAPEEAWVQWVVTLLREGTWPEDCVLHHGNMTLGVRVDGTVVEATHAYSSILAWGRSKGMDVRTLAFLTTLGPRGSMAQPIITFDPGAYHLWENVTINSIWVVQESHKTHYMVWLSGLGAAYCPQRKKIDECCPLAIQVEASGMYLYSASTGWRSNITMRGNLQSLSSLETSALQWQLFGTSAARSMSYNQKLWMSDSTHLTRYLQRHCSKRELSTTSLVAQKTNTQVGNKRKRLGI